MFKAKSLIISSLLLTLSLPAFAKNEWTNSYGNPAHTSFLAQKTNPKKYRELWTKETSEFVSKPVISDNIYYIGIRDSGPYELVALNIKTGNMLWHKEEKETFTMDYAVTYNNSVFVTSAHGIGASTDADYHMLEAYDAKSGNLKYWLRLSNKDPMAVRPLATADSIYVQGNALESMNADTGIYNWMMNIPSQDTLANTLSINDKNIFSHTETNIDVYSPLTGQQDYSLTVPDEHVLLLDVPSIIDQKNNAIYYFDVDKDMNSEIHAYDLTSHALKWSAPNPTREFSANMAVANGEIYAVQQKDDNTQTPGELVNLDSKTGAIKWRWTDESFTKYNSIVATSDTIFVSGQKYTYAVSMKTHQTVWKTEKTGTLSLGKNTLLITNDDSITAIALN